MASIRVRKETGLLFFDFRFRGQRCREQTMLQDTPANRKRLERRSTRSKPTSLPARSTTRPPSLAAGTSPRGIPHQPPCRTSAPSRCPHLRLPLQRPPP